MEFVFEMLSSKTYYERQPINIQKSSGIAASIQLYYCW